MRYSNNGGSGDAAAQGGMVTNVVAELTAARKTAPKSMIDS